MNQVFLEGNKILAGVKIYMQPWGIEWFGPKNGRFTGKFFSEALILATTNPQYDKRLFIYLTI